MKIELAEVSSGDDLVVLRARRRLEPDERVVRYETKTGALLRLDGAVAGAFDREHRRVVVAPHAGAEIVLEVERRSLPSSGLPATGGLRWNLMLRGAEQAPSRSIDVERDGETGDHRVAPSGLALVGHAHLDVAWLWTFAEARRKALRTFATAARLLDLHDRFVYTQSQPQLYEWVGEDDAGLFARVRALCAGGRFDASGAAMWVEPDCNLPSGESLLRQLAFGIRYAAETLGTVPSVAWLPDSFGFPNTLPTLLAHAGIGAFATTKLCWNDTTAFPHRRFVWEGPDGSRVVAALFASYEGGAEPKRVAVALEREEPLVVGYGDGGGGPTDEIVTQASEQGDWTALGDWFAPLREREDGLPLYRDELYLEYHRGVSTTHHDVKARNAALERSLGEAELALAWAVVLRASPFFTTEAQAALRDAWKIVLRNQFHDVLPGTATSDVYADVMREYDRADALVERVLAAARTALPRAAPRADEPDVAPRAVEGRTCFENDRLFAAVRPDGTIDELRAPDGPSLVTSANRLAAYADRPQKWEAWNIDRGYDRKPLALRATGHDVVEDALHVRYAVGGSVAAARISLAPHEPFLRVELAVDWRERRTLLRCENDLALENARAYFGSPYGVVERAAYPSSPAERAKYEACGQRFARVDGIARGGAAAGLALLVRDTYGWSVAGERDRVRLGHSLLRGTTWPDPNADAGEQRIGYAYLPLGEGASMGAVESASLRYASHAGVPLFMCDDPAIVVVATKPADDGDGVVVRLRECDGRTCDAAVACAVRAQDVVCVDALERPVAASVAALRDGAIVTRFAPYELRSFRVRLG